MSTSPPYDTSVPPDATAPVAIDSSSDPPLNPIQRLFSIFFRPTRAWGGLATRAQWWFPTLISMVFAATFSWVLFERAIVPMVTDRFQEQVANGQMTPEAAEKAGQMMSGPVGRMWSVIPQVLLLPVIILLIALVIWLGVAFILGRTTFRYRHALEVAAWSGLVNIPGQIVFAAIAWSRQTMRDVHIGFGIVLPESETPSRLMRALGSFLDALGPFALWTVVVTILGAAALSGAPRKSVAWVLGGLYVALVVLFAGVGALVGPQG